MKYKDYDVFELIRDDYFVKWIKNPDQETIHFWENWLKNNPEKENTVSKAKSIVQGMAYEEQYDLTDEEYSVTLEKLVRLHQNTAKREIPLKRKINLSIVALAIAACFLVFVLVGRMIPRNQTVLPKPKQLSYVTKQAIAGSKVTIRLPDGTTVKLNARSTIRYPEEFVGNSRTVFLEGEGFFDVVRNEHKPFIINSEDIKIQVLGTSFNVRAFKGEKVIKVSVLSGVVKVGKSEGVSLLLEPSAMAIYDKKNNELEKTKFDRTKELGWKDDVLIFDDEPLHDVFKKLEDWFGVTFIIQSNVNASERYSGEYKNETLKHVLDGISYTSNLQFNMKDKLIYVNKK